MHSKPRFPRSSEAAACGASSRAVSRWTRDGAIAARRTAGGPSRVALEDLKRFLVERGARSGGEERATESSDPAHAAESSPRRILVIDDDERFLEVVREVVGSSGYEIETARHGFLAGYLAAHRRPAAILLDILMPGLDGFEVLSLVRRSPEARGIPVVACTSLRGEEIEGRIRAAGFDDYLRKPVDFRVLLDTLARLVP